MYERQFNLLHISNEKSSDKLNLYYRNNKNESKRDISYLLQCLSDSMWRKSPRSTIGGSCPSDGLCFRCGCCVTSLESEN